MPHTYMPAPETTARTENARSARPLENKQPEQRERKGDELMSEEQARRLREVSLKKARRAAMRRGA